MAILVAVSQLLVAIAIVYMTFWVIFTVRANRTSESFMWIYCEETGLRYTYRGRRGYWLPHRPVPCASCTRIMEEVVDK